MKFRLNRYRLLVFLAISNFFGLKSVSAQNATFYEIMYDLTAIRANFLSDSGRFISCNTSYLYSMESNPKKYLDSLSGQFKAGGKIKYVKIGHTESIQNDSLILTIYNDDKAIVSISKVYQSNAHGGQEMMLTNLDSGFIANNVDAVQIVQKGNQRTMSLHFVESSPYMNGTLIYDATTYIPSSYSYVLRQSKMNSLGLPPKEGSMVTINFSGYTNSAFDLSSLNVNKYIQIDGKGKASAQSAFKSFQIIQQGAQIPSDSGLK